MLGHLKQIFLVGGKNSSGARFAQLFRPSRFMSIKVRRFFGMPRILWGTQEIYRLVRLLLSTYIELYWVQYHRFFFHDLSISVSKVGIFKRKKKNLKICSFLGRQLGPDLGALFVFLVVSVFSSSSFFFLVESVFSFFFLKSFFYKFPPQARYK